MKRTLSLVLALVMVLGSFTSVFAAGTTVEEKAGAFLKEAGVLVGNTTTGDLMLKDGLARQDAVVLVAKLMGEIEVAQKFPTSETSPTYKDIKDNFYLPLLAWAQANKTFEGHSAARFGFGENLTAQEYAKVLLVVLGYEVGADKEIKWENVLDKAEELGLLADIDVDATFVRGNMAVMTLNALAVEMKDSTITLAENLNIELPAPELSTDIEITSAVAVANNKVEVKVKEEVAASKADFAIVKKGSTTAVEVKDVVKESAKVFVLETEALVGGTAYTVTANAKSINFTGLAADTTAPTVVKLSATDTNTFVVEFSDRMDFASATNVGNYTFNKDIKVVKATLNADRTKVVLTTDAAKRNISYTLTIQNVMNSDGKVMSKVTRTITAVEDRTAPKLSSLQVQNNRMLVLKFSDSNGMDKAALETVENYTINDLEVISAKAYDVDDDKSYETLVLTTATQVANKSYTLTLNNLVDGSVLANPLGAVSRGFRGASEDKTSPTVKAPISGYNNTLVYVEFNENNAMDPASLEDISNYQITNTQGEILEVLSAEAWDTTYPDGYTVGNKGVTLTTAPQDANKPYRIEVKGVQDEFGNALKPVTGSTYAKYTFTGTDVDVTAPYVTKVEYVNANKVILHFNESLVNATDATNYVINKGIGSAIKAVYKSSTKTVELTTQTLSSNTSYTVTISNVEDKAGNTINSATATFVATATSLDVTAPSLTYVYAANNSEIHVNFDEELDDHATAITLTPALTYNFSGLINDGTTAVYKGSGLVDGTTYTITGVITTTGEFKDAAGNKTVLADITNASEFIGTAIVNEAPAVEYIEQINAKKLKVVFNEPVATFAVAGYTTSKIDTNSPDDHFTEWYLTKTSGTFTVGSPIYFNFGTAKDLSGASSTSTNFDFSPYYEDRVKPTIVGVEAINAKTVRISYDEDLNASGSYKIYYLDNNNRAQYIYTGTGAVSSTSPNQVNITLTASMNADTIYYLEPVSGAMDIAGNREDVTSVVFDFVGSNVLVGNYITGVSIINANNIKVHANKDITAVKVYEGNTAGPVLANTVQAAAKTASVNLSLPLLAGTKYVVIVNNDVANPYTFNGVTPDIGITLDMGTTHLELNFAGYNDELFKYQIYDVNGELTTGPVTFTGATVETTTVVNPTVDTDYYVVLVDFNDTTRVLYAAKVPVVIPAP